jgi:signal recognition particle receptor subunit beta
VIPVVTRRHLVSSDRFRSIAKSYFRRCDGVILMYDVNYERSFLNVRNWIDTIHESTAKRVSIMMVANKIDLRDQSRLDGRRVVEYAEGVRLAKVMTFHVHRASTSVFRSIKPYSSKRAPKRVSMPMKH